MRFVAVAGNVTPDWRGILPGRAIYACPTPDCLERFYHLKRFPARFLKGTPQFAVPRESIRTWVRERAEESLLHFLSLARKSGVLTAGQNAVRTVASPILVLISKDAAERTATTVTNTFSDMVTVIRWGTKERIGEALGTRPIGVLALAASPITERVKYYAEIANLFSRES